jgi:hypothetical protein
VSRPYALAQAPVEIDLSDPKLAKSPALQIAAAKAGNKSAGTSTVTAYAPAQTASIPVTATTSTSAVEASSGSGSSWLGLKRLFGSDESKSEPADAKETAAPQPTGVPLPPKRAAGPPAAPKPQASIEKPHAALEKPANAAGRIAKLIEGSLPTLPDGFLAYAPTSR